MIEKADILYGFNGQESDDEIAGNGNIYTAEFWEYDSRLAMRWNPDPVPRAFQSPYATFAGNPIYFADPSGALEWHPEDDGTGTGNQVLVADQGDDYNTLVTYLEGIYGAGNVPETDLAFYKDQVDMLQGISNRNGNGGEIEGSRIQSRTEGFNNLVGKYLETRQREKPSWNFTLDGGNGCSPTTFKRVDAAVEFVYGEDLLGAYGGWKGTPYNAWQGNESYKGGKFGTGVSEALGLGTLLTREEIENGGLKPGALLRLSQSPGPGTLKVSWHAAIFLHYNYDANGAIIGMTYWQQVTKGGTDQSYTATIEFNYSNGGTYNFWQGYKAVLGLNFR